MSEIQRLERIINVVVGKPLPWAVYGLCLGAKHGIRAAVRFTNRLVKAGRHLETVCELDRTKREVS